MKLSSLFLRVVATDLSSAPVKDNDVTGELVSINEGLLLIQNYSDAYSDKEFQGILRYDVNTVSRGKEH